MNSHYRAYLAEMIGTFAVVFVAAGAVCTSQLTTVSGKPHLHQLTIALAAGLILVGSLAATVGVSGGFLNPAITLTLWVYKRIDGSRAIGLIIAQLLGSFLAGLCLRFMFDLSLLAGDARFGTPHVNVEAFGGIAGSPASARMLLSGIGIEFVLTLIFAFAIYATLLDPRAPQLGVLGPGFAWTALILMAYPLTGAAVNPARWLGPMLWELSINSDAWRDHVPYWIGPIFGALAAGAIYEYLVLPGNQESKS